MFMKPSSSSTIPQ